MSKFGIFLAGLMFLVVLSGSVGAEPTVMWAVTYYSGGVAGGDYADSIITDSNDNVIVTGISTQGYHTIKYDSYGNALWAVDYNGWGYSYGALDIAVDSEDNVILTGGYFYNDTDDYVTIKYDSYGNELWEVAYDSGNHDLPYGVAVDSNNNVIVTGKSNNSCYTIKYDSDGNEVWAKDYEISRYGVVTGVAVDSNDNVIVAGLSQSHLFMIKYDSNGNELKVSTYEGGGYFEEIAVDLNDNVIVTGSNSIDYVTIKYNFDGNEVWTNVYNSGDGIYDRASGVAVDSNNNVIVTGSSGYSPLGGKPDYYTIKYDSDGNEIWAVRYDGGSYDNGRGVAVDSNNNIIVTGTTLGASLDSAAYYTIKYTEDSDGDGVTDSKDSCSDTAKGGIVNADGCSITQICPTDGDYTNHGKYIKCASNAAENFLEEGLITEAEAKEITLAAKMSDIGKPIKSKK